ncbi:hypothetical protein [Streptosporangium carneum]|uniref:Uncharacterized protein n=1 Tax=Streptosporangium carneum TaxID=47481 RepID=A0A9W6HZ22_9ACTN|nr:hypothetical protein [Streptosporangium carneum]GLK08692.1 hypothetical protein GCM10017600_20970 [Streptosporangium carneum]
MVFDDDLKARAVALVARGLTLQAVVRELSVGLAALYASRLRDSAFDAEIVAASNRRLRPLVPLPCPGKWCGTALAYRRYLCRKEPCKRAGRGPSPLDDVACRLRIIAVILERGVWSRDALDVVAKQEGTSYLRMVRRTERDAEWERLLDGALALVRDPAVPHGGRLGYVSARCACKACRDYRRNEQG